MFKCDPFPTHPPPPYKKPRNSQYTDFRFKLVRWSKNGSTLILYKNILVLTSIFRESNAKKCSEETKQFRNILVSQNA